MMLADLLHSPSVGNFLMDPINTERMEAITDRFRLPFERAGEFLDLRDAVINEHVALDEVPELLQQAFGLAPDVAKKLACDVLGTALLPLVDYVPGVAEQIQTWGGDAKKYAEFEIPREKVTADLYAGRLTESLGLSLQPVHIKRLAFLAASYVAGGKTREATKTFFVRPLSIGGLALDDTAAESLLKKIDEDKTTIKLVGEEEVRPVEQKKEMLPEVAPSHEVVRVPEPILPKIASAAVQPRNDGKKVAALDDHGALEAEIASHEKQIQKKGIAAADNRGLEEKVQAIVLAVKGILDKGKIPEKEFSDVVRLALKGVRDSYQTRGVLERTFGLKDEQLVKVLNEITKRQETRAKRQVAAPTPDTLRPTPLNDATILDHRFAAVAGKMPIASAEPVMPSAQVSAARSKEEELALQAKKIDSTKVAQAAAASRPKPAKASLTLGSVPPPQAGGPSVLTDVQFRPKLVGPVEELGMMTAAEFRRLSGDPLEAARKVGDLLATLEATSFEERIRGVEAWRKSPVNTLAARMMSEALNESLTLSEVASRRRNKGEESLSPAELKAISALNARIRF